MDMLHSGLPASTLPIAQPSPCIEHYLTEVEYNLANAVPFASSAHALTCLHKVYAHRLHLLSFKSSAANAVHTAIAERPSGNQDVLFENPALRAAVNCLLRDDKDMSYSRQEATLVLENLSAFLKHHTRSTVRDEGVLPLHPESFQDVVPDHDVRLWSATGSDSGTLLLSHIYAAHEQGRTHIRPALPEEIDVMQQAVKILFTVTPLISQSALRHVRLISLADVADKQARLPFTSFTVMDLPAALYLSPLALSSPLMAAEHLLHEALHVKWYDLRHTHSMMKKGYRVTASRTIDTPWNSPAFPDATTWQACRAVAAFHVYVYLTAFYGLVTESVSQGRLSPSYLGTHNLAGLLARSGQRASYLADAVESLVPELGAAGIRFVEWLRSCLARIGDFGNGSNEVLHWIELLESENAQLHRLQDIDNLPIGDDCFQIVKAQQALRYSIDPSMWDSATSVESGRSVSLHNLLQDSDATLACLRNLHTRQATITDDVRSKCHTMFSLSGQLVSQWTALKGLHHA